MRTLGTAGAGGDGAVGAAVAAAPEADGVRARGGLQTAQGHDSISVHTHK